jgi:fermentation-respiration switch protein FrsA (DUF1100 family)
MGLAGKALDKFVENQIFFPDRLMVQTPSDWGLDFEDVWFEAGDGVRLHAWLVLADSGGPLVLFCHGNAGNISHRLDNVNRLHNIGLSVFIFDYRGYGRSEGRISEQGLYLDADAAYEAARENVDRNGFKLVIFGRSLGGVAAVHIAASKPCAGLILESTFPNLGAMAKQHFPIPGLEGVLKTRFNSLDKIGSVKAPILFFHGDYDDIVPYPLGRELYAAAPDPKEFVTLDRAGHNDTYLIAGQPYFDKWKDFTSSLPESGE